MQILYHASNQEVKTPEIRTLSHFLDFGKGFYTTANLEQARRFAARVVEKRNGVPILNIYSFNDARAFQECSLLSFESPTAEWLDFVAANRKGLGKDPGVDFITGPVANDNIFTTVELYLRGHIGKEEALERFRINKVYGQTAFCTKRALSFLTYVESRRL